MKLSKIQKEIKKLEDNKRYEHSLGVSYTAASLAMRYGCDVEKARIAGLLHDCAKNYSAEKSLKLCKKYNIKVTQVEKDNPFLLHGKVGALLSQLTFEVDDEDILNSITNHTTGRPNMSLLEKIIFVSDYIEPNRSSAPSLGEVRSLAFENIDECLLRILSDTLNYLNNKKAVIDPTTQETYDYYLKELKDARKE